MSTELAIALSEDQLITPPDYETLEKRLSCDIGSQFIKARKLLNYSQTQFAKEMQLSNAQYCKYEKGTDMPKIHTITHWSIITGLPFYYPFYLSAYQPLLPVNADFWQYMEFFPACSHMNEQKFQALLDLLTGLGFASDASVLNYKNIDAISKQELIEDTTNDFYSNIARNFKAQRLIMNWPQQKSAHALGLNLQTYRNYEGSNNPPKMPITLALRTVVLTKLDINSYSVRKLHLFRERQRQRYELLLPLLKKMSIEQKAQIKSVCYNLLRF